MESEPGKFPPPPGLIHSLMAGFDTVANHIWIIALPVLLDLFLWLGPHLRLRQLMQPFVTNLPSLLSSPLSANLPNPSTVQQAWTEFLGRFNLFAILRTFPVGITSLLSLQMPEGSPLGTPLDLEASSLLGAVAWGLLLVFFGWLAGGLYYQWVAGVTLKLESRPLRRSLAQTVLLSVVWSGLLFIIGIPIFLLFTILALISQLLAQLSLFIFALGGLWLVMPIFFSAHGIFTYQQDAFRAILNSLRMVRFTLPTTGLFLLAAILIGQGLDFLWRTPPDNSWLMLVGIAGHAFISTALLAASFVYYRDINAWLKEVFEKLKARATSARI